MAASLSSSSSLSRLRERAGVRVCASAKQTVVSHLKDRVGLDEQFAVRDPQQVEPVLLQHRGPRRIASQALIFVVLTTVQLDDEPALDAGEVGEERTDGVLPAELGAGEATVTELRPEEMLGVGGGGAEVASPCGSPHPSPLPQAGEGGGRRRPRENHRQSPLNTGLCFAAKAS